MAAALSLMAALAATLSAAHCTPGTTPNCTDAAALCEPYEAGFDVTIPDSEASETSTDSSSSDADARADADAGPSPVEASVRDGAASGG